MGGLRSVAGGPMALIREVASAFQQPPPQQRSRRRRRRQPQQQILGVSSPPTPGAATIAGQGDLGQPAPAIQAPATLTGQGSIADTATDSAGGTIGGQGSLGVPPVVQGAGATLQGQGRLSGLVVTEQAPATLTGSSSLSGTVAEGAGFDDHRARFGSRRWHRGARGDAGRAGVARLLASHDQSSGHDHRTGPARRRGHGRVRRDARRAGDARVTCGHDPGPGHDHRPGAGVGVHVTAGRWDAGRAGEPRPACRCRGGSRDADRRWAARHVRGNRGSSHAYRPRSALGHGHLTGRRDGHDRRARQPGGAAVGHVRRGAPPRPRFAVRDGAGHQPRAEGTPVHRSRPAARQVVGAATTRPLLSR